MEHAPLRPVPSRRSGPVDPDAAMREVAAALPGLDAAEARALALVALAERPRAEVAEVIGIEHAELGALLARARKELRRTVSVLGGSGWCERAEELVSDRLDGELATADAGRLDVHLRNCPRCVEHERRLVQATDWLASGVLGGAPPETPAHLEPPVPLTEAPEDEAEPPAADAKPPAAEAEAPAAEIEPPTSEREFAAAQAGAAAAAPRPGEIAAAAEVLVTKRTRGQLAAAVAWNSMIAIAVLLTLATIALTIAGILGAEL